MKNRHLVAATIVVTSGASLLLATSFSPPAAALLVGGVLTANGVFAAGAFGPLLESRIEWRWLMACCAIALALTLLGGEGHVFFSKDDWLGRDAVLSDLVKSWSPVFYRHEDADFILRAPLGMYLIPAAIGRIAGLSAAHAGLVAQTALLLGVFFYAATLLWPRGRLAFILLFVCFSGLDCIPVLIKTGGAALLRVPAFWVEIGYFPAHLSQLFWAPTHALPGWWFALLVALHVRREIDLAALAAASLPLILWSPLALIGGAAIFVLLSLLAPRALLSRRFALACASGLGFLPVLAYLGADAESVPHGLQMLDAEFWDAYRLLVLFGLTQIIVVLAFWRRIESWFRPLLAISCVLLLVSPLFDLGYMNDVTQRASLAPRAILAFGFDALLIDFWVQGAWLAFAGGGLVFLIGAVSPVIELYDTLGKPRFSISDCNLLTAYDKHGHASYLPSYIARAESFPSWLFDPKPQKAPLVKETRLCWPDRIYGEKLFNWLEPKNRIWLRAPRPEELQ